MEETFKDVVGFEDLFKISNKGNLWSKRSQKILKQHIHKNGYYVCSTKIGGRKGVDKCFKIHRLVAEAFIPNPENKPTVNHKDTNKLNNNVENLEWATHSEQTEHAYANGLISKRIGENNPAAKITNSDAWKILEARQATGLSAAKLEILLGYPASVIRRVIDESSTSWVDIRSKFKSACSSIG